MCSVEAGSKARPEMYVLGARQVMEAVGMDLACLTRLCVRKRFLEPVQDSSKTTEMKKISIKTLRNKLKFLEYFCKYLLSDNCTGWVTDTWREQIEKLREDLPGWRQSLRGPCTTQELQRRVLDGQEAVTPADIKQYRESEYSLVATKILQDRCEMPNATPSVSDFLRCRNHMIVVISIANAHRSGVLCNFTTADYENGLRSQGKEDGSRCFKIVEHKTATTHGTANIAVDAEEAHLLSYYMTMRNKLDVENIAPYVFVNSTGTKMSPSNIGSALTCAFGSSGYNERVTCSKLRKTAVTEIHTKFPEKKGDLAAHMCHREATAAKFYRLIAKESNSLDSANLLRQALGTSDATAEKSMHNAVQSIALLPLPAHSIQLTANSGSHEYEENNTDTNNVDDMTDDCENSDNDYNPEDDDESAYDYTSEKYSQSSRGKWSVENASLIKTTFADLIEKHSAPISDITSRLNNVPDLRKRLEHDLKKSGSALDRTVRDKVRTFYRHIYGYKKGKKKPINTQEMSKLITRLTLVLLDFSAVVLLSKFAE